MPGRVGAPVACLVPPAGLHAPRTDAPPRAITDPDSGGFVFAGVVYAMMTSAVCLEPLPTWGTSPVAPLYVNDIPVLAAGVRTAACVSVSMAGRDLAGTAARFTL
jgi:hypothetical protein